MKKYFVDYELAVLLHKAGFNEECKYHFHYDDETRHFCSDVYCLRNNVSGVIQLPLYEQVKEWFREKHNMNLEIYQADSGNYVYSITSTGANNQHYRQDGNFPYYEALKKGVIAGLEFFETKLYKSLNENKIMQRYFVSFEIAKLLKELKFDGKCIALYSDEKLKERSERFIAIDQHWGMDLSGLSYQYSKIMSCEYLAPLHQQVLEWLEEEHRICIYSQPILSGFNMQGRYIWPFKYSWSICYQKEKTSISLSADSIDGAILKILKRIKNNEL